MRTAFLFPGQGAPAADWRSLVAEYRPELLAEATAILGCDPFERFGDGTLFDQLAILCASLTAFELTRPSRAAVHAGHSLGEIAALTCARVFDWRDAVRLVAKRGQLMAEAAMRAGDGGMLAVGAPAEQLTPIEGCPGLCVANLNSPTQTVLSGPVSELQLAAERLRGQGVRTKRLPVAGAFHSPAMRPAAEAFEAVLEDTVVAEPAVPVLSSRSGLPFREVRTELAASLVDPVRWIDVVASLEAHGIERCIEVGPGRALSVLVRRTARTSMDASPLAVPEATNA